MSFMEKRRTQLERHEIVSEIVVQLKAFETDLGRALSSGSQLVGLLPAARARANVSDVVGQDVISHFIAALGHIDQAMARAVSGHLRLDDIRRDLRIPETAGGDKIPLPVIGGVAGISPSSERRDTMPG